MKITEVPNRCLVTYSGLVFDYFNPTVDMINIEDIAIGLSRECRFANQTREAYTVAQHSVLVSTLAPTQMALEALLHDAPEAYMKDIPTMLKVKLPEYQAIENNLMKVIAEKFNIKYPFPEEIKKADQKAFQLEWNMLYDKQKTDYCWSARLSRKWFMQRFEELTIPKLQ
jgi:hypothetical protein